MIKRVLRHTFSLLNTDHVKLDRRWNYKNVISPYHRIYYIDEGEGEISNMETALKLEAGYLYIIPSFTLCNLTCQSYLSQFFVQFFEESSDGISMFANNRSLFKVKANEIDVINFKRLVTINPGRGINRSDNPRIYEKNVFYKEYQDLNNQQNMADFLETQGLLLQLVARFATAEVFKQKEVRYIPVKILDSISYISVSLHLPLSVSLLAERANLNPEYFSRLFQEFTGIRPLAYINEKRIERAQYLVVTSPMTYSEIAEQTGFESLSHFSRNFKQITGLCPRAYKQQIYSNRPQ
ncbi:helix-turn-helix domain-containing protein [Mucilaginibacter sp. KACC 22063]|uniref:helix-turn-helix domain-containing protein n=1 Tax=Mucilaginibacter sp. KACC 22063 TaxID=3025666 RepID=UPI002365496D|nr:AraC family transcriptional regulator [Mucilaginibacter sp. KACC 22063]WDF57289.1 AraC family transcriptional regulator [Mucilaginibacter sp. KACC 22063]